MIGRRSFFKSILGAIAGVALAQKIALEPVSADVIGDLPAPHGLKVNPAWEDAEYEEEFFIHPSVLKMPIGPAPWPENLGETSSKFRACDPERWTFSDGEFKKVPKHLP
jgi:hypothetical protein